MNNIIKKYEKNRINLKLFLRGYDLSIKEKSNYSYELREKDEIIRISRLKRYKKYLNGIKNRINYLAEEYAIENISFLPNDILIDCGANVGELGIWAKKIQGQLFCF